MSIVDLRPRLRQKRDNELRKKRPDREPDFELHGWLEGSDVNWSFFGVRSVALGALDEHHKIVEACVDASWNIAANTKDHDGPAIWFLLDQQGRHTLIWTTGLLKDTTWRNAWWLAKQWWRLSIRWWRLVWRAARGRG